jgi:hypothetical protein
MAAAAAAVVGLVMRMVGMTEMLIVGKRVGLWVQVRTRQGAASTLQCWRCWSSLV